MGSVDFGLVEMNGAEISGGGNRTLVFVVVEAEAISALHRAGPPNACSLRFERGRAATTIDNECEGGGGEVHLPGLDRVFLERGGRHVESNGVLALTTRSAATGHPDLAGFHLSIFEKDTNGEGDIARVRNAVVVFLDKLNNFGIGDELVEESSDKFVAGNAIR
jgi:hypothetical protein